MYGELSRRHCRQPTQILRTVVAFLYASGVTSQMAILCFSNLGSRYGTNITPVGASPRRSVTSSRIFSSVVVSGMWWIRIVCLRVSGAGFTVTSGILGRSEWSRSTASLSRQVSSTAPDANWVLRFTPSSLGSSWADFSIWSSTLILALVGIRRVVLALLVGPYIFGLEGLSTGCSARGVGGGRLFLGRTVCHPGVRGGNSVAVRPVGSIAGLSES